MMGFRRDQCEIADSRHGPWREPAEGESARWWRVKPDEMRRAMIEGGLIDPTTVNVLLDDLPMTPAQHPMR